MNVGWEIKTASCIALHCITIYIVLGKYITNGVKIISIILLTSNIELFNLIKKLLKFFFINI